jgi:peroxiredoxin
MRLWPVLLLCGMSLAAQNVRIATKAKVGDTAPDFTLPSSEGKEFRLSDYRGKNNVVLAFVIKAFTGG